MDTRLGTVGIRAGRLVLLWNLNKNPEATKQAKFMCRGAWIPITQTLVLPQRRVYTFIVPAILTICLPKKVEEFCDGRT